MDGNLSQKTRLTEPSGMSPRTLPTDAVRGFTRVTTCEGRPTGVPAEIPGQIPLVIDSVNRELYAFISGIWVSMSQDFYSEVAKGNVPGHSLTHKFGRNPTAATGVWEGVNLLSTAFVWLTVPTTVRVKAGGNADDTAAGVGAQSITFEGLGPDGSFATAFVDTAGALVSASTTQTFIRLDRVFVTKERVGTYGGNNIGDIVIEDSAGVADLISIMADEGQSQHGAFTIPLGKTGFLLSISMTADSIKPADFRLFTRRNILNVTTPFDPSRIKLFFDGVVGSQDLKPKSPIKVLPALTDIWMEVRGGGAQTEVSVDLEILLVDSTLLPTVDPVLADLPLRIFDWQPAIDGLTPLIGEGIGTFVRATTATYIDEDGVIQSVGSGEHRIQDGGLLLEPSRENLILRSEEFNDVVWTKTRSTISSDATTAPDDTLTADKLVEDSSNGISHYIYQTVTSVALNQYTLSVFAKAAERDWLIVYATEEGEGKFFDLANGVVGSDRVGAPDDSGIEALDNGWFRCWIVVTASGTSLSNRIYAAISNLGHSYDGDGTSGVYLWGGQTELGAYFTSYIPTVASSVVRNADALSLPYSKVHSGHGITYLIKAITHNGVPVDQTFWSVGSGAPGAGEFLLQIANTRMLYAGPSEGDTAYTSGIWAFVDTVENDAIVHLDITEDELNYYDDSDVLTTVAATVTTGMAPDADIMEYQNNIGVIITAVIAAEGNHTPTVMRQLLRA